TPVERSTSKPTDDINRIIIGLGGQGSRVVNEVRKAVLRHGPLPAGLEFIAIDSDRIALSNLDSVPEGQRIHLAAPDDNITETIVPWLPHEFRPKAGGGCGMQRLTGKAMYLVHRHRVMETVREVARKLRQRTQVSDFMVVVVNAFGGGTGSGMAIDFAVDLRADLRSITGQDPLLFGIGVLPSRSETIQRANGVAMIKELHLLLSNKEPVIVGGRDYSNPFELYFLVGREVMGIERDEELMRSIVRFTIDLGLIPSSSRDKAQAGKGAGWVDLQDIRTLVKGAGHMFSTFGCYRAAFPADDLLRYFEALEKPDALRKEMPGLATDLESQRQALEDRKIALAAAEEALRLAKARAARLRSDGILGANRPDLAQLLGEIGRLEDETRKVRREAEAAERDLPALAARRQTFEAQLREWETRAQTLKASLLAPVQSRTTYTVPLTEEEIAFLRQNRHLLEEGCFRTVMEALGRGPDYLDKTMEVVGKNKILFLPLLNYRMSFQTASAFPPQVLSALHRHGFVRFDATGNPVVSDDHLWMVMAMLSSNPENVDASKVSARAFKEVVEGHVARRAEAKIVPSDSKRWEVLIHSWMVGVQVAPVAPGYPPRLRELEWLSPEYEQVAREGGLAQHHAFLYGDPLAFSHLTSVAVDRLSAARTNELVTEFWGSYAPIDAPARWLQLPPVVAETAVATEGLAKAATAVVAALDEFRASATDAPALDRLGVALAQGTEGLQAFGRAYADDVNPLRGRLGPLLTQLERARAGPKDPEKLLA
ncbi:MAG TPA: tubulin-like doman-containing protein, partial [Candidatus Thermoplasmatota archaeon]|nr:tubulin-like doman-containing protein [Candidatus Thermoplasmatota archaeon]